MPLTQQGGQVVSGPTWTDSGSGDLATQVGTRGLLTVEVFDQTAGLLIGAAVVAVEPSPLGGAWAAILSSAARATAPLPTFSIVGSAVHIATAGASGHTITVTARAVTQIGYRLEV